MKIRLTLTVEVDQVAWSATFGTPAAEVREEVTSHVVSLVNDDTQGLLRVVGRA